MTVPDNGRPAVSPSQPIPPVVKLLTAVGLVWLVWQAAMFGVRAYVDTRIAEPVGGRLGTFDLETVAGGRLTAADLRGRWVVLNCFRSRCASCNVEAPVIRELAANVDPAQVAVIGVLVDRVEGYAPETTAETLRRFDFRHPVVHADAAFLEALHGAGWANVTPVTYIVSPDGTLTRSLRGHQSLETLVGALPAGAVR